MTFPNPFASDDELTHTKLNEVANALLAVANLPVEMYRGTMFHDESVVIAGAAIELVLFASGSNNMIYARQTAAALNDEFKNGLYLAPDTYTMQVVGFRSASSGIVTWYVDDVVVGTTDLYFGLESYNYYSITSIVIAEAGWHVIKGKVASKNASSSGYNAGVFKVNMTGSLA